MFTYRTSSDVQSIIGNRDVLPPVDMRRLWTRSRLVRLADGTTTPLLQLLAEHKFIAWDPATHFAYWLDRDHTNESLENVGLCAARASAKTGRKRSSIPHPAGSREYWAEYRKRHAAQNKAYQRRHREKVKKALAAFRAGSVPAVATPDSPESLAGSDEKFISLLKALDKTPPETK